MALLEPGDEVVVVLPGYVSYVPQIYIAEPEAVVKIVNLKKDDYSLDMEAIEHSVTLKTKVIIFNSPHNPTGIMIPKADQLRLFEIAEKNDAYIISDEIYDRLVFGDEKHFSIGSLEGTVDRVITVNGFGKSHAITGWRIGYAIVPQQLMGKVTKLQQHINTNTTTLLQQAIDLAWPLPVDHLTAYNEKLRKRAELFKNFLTAHTQLKGSNPKGSFFVFLNISSTGLDSNTFSSQLVDKMGVATTPGIAFGKDWDDHIRLSLAVDESVLKEAFNRIHNFIENKLWL
jgi:aspartate/methionine/tyrosine aminotransferase